MLPRAYPYHIILILGVLIVGSCLEKEEDGKKRVLGKLRRRHGNPPSYAVPMEPVVHYSQRDPLYHQKIQESNSPPKEQSDDHNTARLDYPEFYEQAVASDNRYEVGSYYPPSYYTQPEPIIEIIIKESNETLPTTPSPPPRPTTKEPIHVFYVKYKKNPNPKGKDDQIIYDPPIPALVPHSSDIKLQEANYHSSQESASYSPPASTTTLRTIIRPESETYHSSNAGVKVTFGSPDETELEEGSEQRPRVVPPPDSHSLPSNYRPEHIHIGHSRYQQHQFNIRQAPPPTQVFNSHSHSNVNPSNTPLGPVQESSYQNSKFAPPTEEQIRQYQQEKLFLYQQSLKQQQNVHHSSIISPIVPPQQFQQPTSIPPSELQLNFNNQKQRVQHGFQQQAFHQQDPRGQHYKLTPQHHQQIKPVQYQQKQPYSNQHQAEHTVKPLNSYHNTLQRLPERAYPQDYQNNKRNHPHNQQPAQTNHHSPNYQLNNVHPSNLPSLAGIKQESIQPGISVYERTIVSQEIPKEKGHISRPSPNPELHFYNQQNSYKHNYQDGEIVKSVAQSEDHQVTPDYRNVYSALHEPPKRNKLPQSEDPLQFYPIYSTTSPPSYPQEQQAHRISTTVQRPRTSTSTPQPTKATTESTNVLDEVKYDVKASEDQPPKENATAVKVNLAALPDEIPEDLRAQLLSSGILGNADIQILDYDKVGDIPIESLPPEALENFYSAGSEPIPSVVKPETNVTALNPSMHGSLSEKSQKTIKPFSKKYGSQLESKALKDSKYNRYLPLKINGSDFLLSDSPQLKGRSVKSVVVLAPVDYDFIRERDEGDERAGKAIQVEGVRFVAGEALKDLVRNPTRENYSKWLDQERETPPKHQSVVLLITRKDDDIKSTPEIFMFDVNSSATSKLRGELSQTFVEVAEANSYNHDLDGINMK